MAIQIKKAVRQRIWLKIAVMGPSGAGKTYGGIAMAEGLASTGRVLLVDTENGSASYYADKWDFDVVDMHAPFTSQKYLEVLNEAVRLGYEVIVFDSMSHEWAASGGVLDKKADFDRAKGEKWGNWQDAKKPHALFKEAWLQAPIHVIATMRSKMEYVLETNDKGKQVPRKVGLAPIQDGDSEYEFGVAFEIDRDTHFATAAKDRTGLFDGRVFTLGEEIGRELAAWRDSGAELAPEPQPPAPATAQPQPDPFTSAMVELAAVSIGMPEKTRAALIAEWEKAGPAELPALLQEIETIRQPETAPQALTRQQELVTARKPPVSAEASAFVDAMDADTDEANGGINADQYVALRILIEANGINRDALRAYCVKAGHLLPSLHPTLARLKAAEFVKLRARLASKDAAKVVGIINKTAISPQGAAA